MLPPGKEQSTPQLQAPHTHYSEHLMTLAHGATVMLRANTAAFRAHSGKQLDSPQHCLHTVHHVPTFGVPERAPFTPWKVEIRSIKAAHLHLHQHFPKCAKREREREAETQAEGEAGSMHREPDVGFDPGSPGSRPGPKAGAKPLHHPGIPESLFFKADKSNNTPVTPKGTALKLNNHAWWGWWKPGAITVNDGTYPEQSKY
ncbi:unnamed protein product [Nyctereutes procyonoides]|uniref:(raccoon dog) hypothetical protein n=1 Tax=Nyctereutes procyonoides TaxID=34880 RepID=A0A811YAD8_NYCPR|nr:unnamed protein product [Nyctereutes procyonoides]